MKTILHAFLGALLLVTATALAAGSSADPVVGTWTLNVAKSKVSPGPPPKSETRTYSESADGTTMLTSRTVSAEGKEDTVSMSYKADGKDYPVTGSPAFDTVSVKRISSHSVSYSVKKAGKVVVTGRRTVSKDGKELTLTGTGTDKSGAKVAQTMVYDKQ